MSVRTLDMQGRWRSVTVAFRISPEENALLDTAVRLSGLTKQEYIIRRLQDHEISVQGNSRVYKALRLELEHVQNQLARLSDGESVDSDLLKTIRMLARVMEDLKQEPEQTLPPKTKGVHPHDQAR